MPARQLSLLSWSAGAAEPALDGAFAGARRIDFGRGAWIEHVRSWVRGADALFDELVREMRWHAESRLMYERIVEVPRLFAQVPQDGVGPPLLGAMARALSHRYDAPLDVISLGLYRDGRDSVAWHRDRGHRDRERSVVAIASLGGTRRLLVRPLGGGASSVITMDGGDLVVMGGACQRTLEHCVPKVKRAEPRIALMFRHRAPISPRVAGDPTR